jgi:hypothetical protein
LKRPNPGTMILPMTVLDAKKENLSHAKPTGGLL